MKSSNTLPKFIVGLALSASAVSLMVACGNSNQVEGQPAEAQLIDFVAKMAPGYNPNVAANQVLAARFAGADLAITTPTDAQLKTLQTPKGTDGNPLSPQPLPSPSPTADVTAPAADAPDVDSSIKFAQLHIVLDSIEISATGLTLASATQGFTLLQNEQASDCDNAAAYKTTVKCSDAKCSLVMVILEHSDSDPAQRGALVKRAHGMVFKNKPASGGYALVWAASGDPAKFVGTLSTVARAKESPVAKALKVASCVAPAQAAAPSPAPSPVPEASPAPAPSASPAPETTASPAPAATSVQAPGQASVQAPVAAASLAQTAAPAPSESPAPAAAQFTTK